MTATAHEHDLGLAHDLAVMQERGLVLPASIRTAIITRRRALTLFGIGALALAGCGASSTSRTASSSGTSGSTGSTGATTSTTAAAASGRGGPPGGGGMGNVAQSSNADALPNETAGPYPGDGSNGPNVLGQSGVVRRDITKSFGSSSGTADGSPVTIRLTVVDASTDEALPGAAVYVWHATPGGEYSLYGRSVKNENFLRGVQVADSNGVVEFDSVWPGCYDGRWPHLHFEVYADQATALAAGSKLATSQMALPEATCKQIYANDGRYSGSTANLDRVTLASDMVFGDGYDKELGTASGTVGSSLAVALTVPVAT